MKKGDIFPINRNDLYYIENKIINSCVGNYMLRAEYIGEFRNPKKGEWYLSGSLIEAYFAHNDLPDRFHIAKLVKVVSTLSVSVVERY